jgi:hypothetical protein
MITIENVSGGTKGIQNYSLKIGSKLICTFDHNRDRGLVVCLKEAAAAVLEKEKKDKRSKSCKTLK